MRAVRIGIDVGGTFTDAVALDQETRELIGQAKSPTTHSAEEGVARGVVTALHRLMREAAITPDEIRFIAHGTTQATNALLEGDVAPVGIVATGTGIEGARARSETEIADVELAEGKHLRSRSAFVDSGALAAGLDAAIAGLRDWGAQVIVAAAPFSVDDPALERKIMDRAAAAGLPAVGTHELSKLYGLRMRTRTAVVNASILPRMMDAAGRTAESVRQAGIAAPLMVMRCDGGVMTVEEMRRRPILTVLSGPAAGVAGALLYEKISRGIFLEVGGTSTDLSAVRDGRVMIDYAEIGGHKTYVSSLDVRTIGTAGGSMARVDLRARRVLDAGPRSAHIAGLPYAVFADPSDLRDASLDLLSPRPGDPGDYACIRAKGGRFALTTACAANLLGLAKPGDYAYGNRESTRLAFAPLAAALGVAQEEAARLILEAAARKIVPVVEALLRDYGLDRSSAELVGGGGGAAAIVPFVAGSLGMRSRLARSHEVISPIGVALALVRETVERTVVSPGPEDLLRIKREAEEAAIRSGAAAETVEVAVEVDAGRNLLRAIATGATEMRARPGGDRALSEPELQAVAARDMGVRTASLVARAGRWYVYEGATEPKQFFWKRTRRAFRVLDAEGVVVLARDTLEVTASTIAEWPAALERALRQSTRYGDSGAVLPETHVLCGAHHVGLSGAATAEQMRALAASELDGRDPAEPLLILCSRRE